MVATRSGRRPVASATWADIRCVLPVPEGPCRNRGLISRLRRCEQTHSVTRWMARKAGRFSGVSIQCVNVFMLSPDSAKWPRFYSTFYRKYGVTTSAIGVTEVIGVKGDMFQQVGESFCVIVHCGWRLRKEAGEAVRGPLFPPRVLRQKGAAPSQF